MEIYDKLPVHSKQLSNESVRILPKKRKSRKGHMGSTAEVRDGITIRNIQNMPGVSGNGQITTNFGKTRAQNMSNSRKVRESENGPIFSSTEDLMDQTLKFRRPGTQNIISRDAQGNKITCGDNEEIYMDTSDLILLVNDNNMSDMSDIRSGRVYLNSCPLSEIDSEIVDKGIPRISRGDRSIREYSIPHYYGAYDSL